MWNLECGVWSRILSLDSEFRGLESQEFGVWSPDSGVSLEKVLSGVSNQYSGVWSLDSGF